MLNKNIVLSAVFALSGLTGTLPQAAAQGGAKLVETVKPGSARIGGSFEGLTHNGKPFDPAVLKGKYLLVFFGTANRLPTCLSDVVVIDYAMDQLASCPEARKRIVPVFICPDYKGAERSANVEKAQKEGGFVILRGSMQAVETVARKYAARYEKGEQGVTDHTKFSYLMDPKGKNLAIFPPDPLNYVIPEQVKWSMKEEGVLLECR